MPFSLIENGAGCFASLDTFRGTAQGRLGLEPLEAISGWEIRCA
jgi:hypothetical protein